MTPKKRLTPAQIRADEIEEKLNKIKGIPEDLQDDLLVLIKAGFSLTEALLLMALKS